MRISCRYNYPTINRIICRNSASNSASELLNSKDSDIRRNILATFRIEKKGTQSDVICQIDWKLLLEYTCERCNMDIVNKIICEATFRIEKKGAQSDVIHQIDWNSALKYACKGGNMAIVNRIICEATFQIEKSQGCEPLTPVLRKNWIPKRFNAFGF